MARGKIMGVILEGKSYEDNTADLMARARALKPHFEKSKNKIIFSLLPAREHKITVTIKLTNQLIVQYTNGTVEILPKGITGYKVKDYLGVQYGKIKAWGVLPITGKRLPNGTRDFYGAES
jgi:hypothetical protein